MNIAENILDQLGGRRFIAMTGASCFADYGDAISFKLPSRFALQGINFVKVRLTARDLYDIQFGQVRGKTFQVVEEREDLGWEELQPTFTAVTGLDTHL